MYRASFYNMYHTSGCCVAIPAYTKCDIQLTKVAPDDGLI